MFDGVGPIEPLSSEEQTVVALNFDTGHHRRSYVANIDVTHRQSVESFFRAIHKVVQHDRGAEFRNVSRGDGEVFRKGSDKVR